MPDIPTGSGITRLLEIIAILRGEEGCPWDRAQTLETLKPFLVEEAYELVDAIESDDPELHKEELGDVLLQVVLQAQIRAEENRFDFDAVADVLSEKLVRRHPHVFGDADAETPEQVTRNWEAIKRNERGGAASLLDGVPKAFPELKRAQALQTRAARVGFDWHQTADVVSKIEEEVSELREALSRHDRQNMGDEIGDILFSVVNLARRLDYEAEDLLRYTSDKFTSRFTYIEETLRRCGRNPADADLAELDALWDEAKKKLPGENSKT